MFTIIELYGLTDVDIDTAAETLASILDIPFVPHDSSFWGEYYRARREDPSEKFSLKENFNEMEDDWNEPLFQEYPLILEVSIDDAPTRAAEVEKLLADTGGALAITLLRRNEYPD